MSAVGTGASGGRVRRMGLGARIVAWSLLLLLLVQVTVLLVVRLSVERSTLAQVNNELQVSERVWLRMLDQHAQRLRQGAALLASDFGFRAAVLSGDVETIRSALTNHGARISADVTALLDPQFQIQATGEGEDDAGIRAVLQQVAAALATQPDGARVALVGGKAFQFVMVPARAPLVVAWVLMGFPIDQNLVDSMRDVSGDHVVLTRGQAGERLEVLVSTLPGQMFDSTRVGEVMPDVLPLQGDRHVLRIVTLPGTGGDVRTVLLRSYEDALAPYRRLQWLLAAITAAGLALFAVGSALAARWLTTPLRLLVDASVRIGRGDYRQSLDQIDRRDEIGELASAFDHMRVNVDRQQRQIRRLAYWDRLTGLPNRTHFNEMLAIAIDPQRGGHEHVAVIMLDLDRLKHVNDVLGYAFGDKLLKSVGLRLQAQTRHRGDRRIARRQLGGDRRSGGDEDASAPMGDFVARLGGDEFAMLLIGDDALRATEMAKRIARSFEVPMTHEQQTVDMSAGLGIAAWPQHGQDADTLMAHAEIAMYAAKRQSTGVCVYEAALDVASPQTLSMLSDLRQALENGELRLFLQPKVAVRTGVVVGAEALVRWQHPARGMVSPAEFIPFAEQTGFIRQLTLWMVGAAARHWREVQRPDMRLRIAVNLSTRDLLDQDLPAKLMGLLREHGVQPDGFCLEITESAIIDDPQRAEATLNRLSALGFKLAIDDYGTGYSSLAYIRRLPVDELKIDKSFVMGMEKSADDEKIVQSTIDLAHNLGLSVVAEGVESRAILLMLRDFGCDEGQGYHMSRPIPIEAFNAWCDDWMSSATRVMELQ